MFNLALNLKDLQVYLIFQFQKMWNVHLGVVLKYLGHIVIVGNLILMQQHAIILVKLLFIIVFHFFNLHY